MSDAENPRFAAPELETLREVLDAHREKIVKSVSGLSDNDIRRGMVPSGTSLLGIMKHLGYVERFWFQIVFAGLDVPLAYSDEDPKAEWRIEPDETTDDVVAFYNGETARARELTAGATAETRAAGTITTTRGPSSQFALRWILLHMIEETAQHNGHADIIRELIEAEGAGS